MGRQYLITSGTISDAILHDEECVEVLKYKNFGLEDLAFGGGATAETDWKEASQIIWRDLQNDIGANGIVEVHQPEEYSQLHYYDDVKPKRDATQGDYYEKFRAVSDKGACTLSIEIGKMQRRDIPFHQKMWDKALNIIKEVAEKELS